MLGSKRKGVELSMNVIIVLALALMVLAITAFFIIKNTDMFNEKTSCDGREGICKLVKEPCPEDKPVISPFSCGDKNTKCCTNIGAEE